MVATLISSSLLVLASGFLVAGDFADETCMLQYNKSVGAHVQQVSARAAADKDVHAPEKLRRSIHELSRSKHSQAMSLLETRSATDSGDEAAYVNFHNPRVWGPAGWFFFHSIAFAQADQIDEAQQERLQRFFTETMPHILPCPQCGQNAENHIQDMDIDDTTFASRDGVARFVWNLHDNVNDEKLGRNEDVHVDSYEQSKLNFAQAFNDGVTRLHFNNDNSESESAAVVKSESESADVDNSESESADADNSGSKSANVDNSESESAAVDNSESPQEHHPVELLVSQTSASESSMFSRLLRFFSSYFA